MSSASKQECSFWKRKEVASGLWRSRRGSRANKRQWRWKRRPSQ